MTLDRGADQVPGTSPEPAPGDALVVGVGNPHRGDDGIGAAVAERAAADPRLAGPAVRVRTQLQLTPELAADLAGASVAVLVDARAGAGAGEVRWSRVEESPAGPSPLSHHLSPEALMALAGLAYGRLPRTYVVSVGAEDFEAGAPLSPTARAAVPAAVDVVVALVTGRGSARP